MTPLSDVQHFLRDFQFKLSFRDKVLFSSRPKNRHTMFLLELSLLGVKEELKKITALDYSQGPLDDTVYGDGSMWVFGRIIKEYEIYIKVALGKFNGDPLCISFHIAEYPLHCPYKEQK
jgi:hypothetical protein